jgi:L-ribulokinase
MNDSFVIGLDFGTDSIRCLLVETESGEEVSSAVYPFERWKRGDYCDAVKNQYRQHPLDHIEGLKHAVNQCISAVPSTYVRNIIGIGVDTTGSTPGPIDKSGVPLALQPDFKDNPNAMFILWKDHTAVVEAEEINRTAKNWGGVDFTRFSGGVYSSEWFWSKILNVIRTDGAVREYADTWLEHCDWIPALLTDNNKPRTIKRSRCAAGHKGMWNESLGGLPSEEFLVKVDPLFEGLRKRLYSQTFTSDTIAGYLSKNWANILGLSEGVPVAVGALDAHVGAVGGAISPYVLSKVIGTSTCDMLVVPKKDLKDKCIRGISGQVDGSILPEMIGMEAGQSAFGDIYSWFRDILSWPLNTIEVDNTLPNSNRNDIFIDKIIPTLSEKAEFGEISEESIIALDWFNGRRTPNANQMLKGALINLSLGSDAPTIFRSLVEATAFGSKRIVEQYEEEGVNIKEVVALGGVAKKSPFVMKVLADVMDRNIKVVKSEETCALGSAMFAATVGGKYKTVSEAMQTMKSGYETEYKPNSVNVKIYNILYDKYKILGDFVEHNTKQNQ